ncbi:MAG TPA: zf-HC2 domain-containing protein [Blastocatellia bacterium]|nr:zf-HC2 domain-containing protein [Blastocatellia bacterium]
MEIESRFLSPQSDVLIMECKKFELTASAYADRQLPEAEAAEYRAHLSACDGCRLRLTEIEQVSLLFRDLEQPETPRELHSYVMTAVTRRANRDISFIQLVVDWLQKLNPRLVAYSASVVISVVSFGALFSSFKPMMMDDTPRTEQAAIFPVISGSDREYHSYNGLPPDEGSNEDEHYYQLPRVLDNGSLVSFSHITYQKAGNQGMSAMVEVESDGRARLLDIIDAPKDPYLIEQLWWSLSNRTFQPATVSGHPVPTRIILLVERMDVSG